MFIVWGTKRSDRKLGRVADYCPICDDARACQLIVLRMVEHLYYLPLGKAEVVGHILRCEQCKHVTEGDPQNYIHISKDRRASIQELIDLTHPQLKDSLDQWFELRGRAARGEVNDDERRELIFHPFRTILSPVIERRSWGMRIDGRSSLWLVTMFVLPLLMFVAINMVATSWMTDAVKIALVSGCFVLPLILLIVSVARDTKRFIRRRYWQYLVKFLATLNPTSQELDEVITDLKRHKQTAVVGKRINPNALYDDIKAFMDSEVLRTEGFGTPGA